MDASNDDDIQPTRSSRSSSRASGGSAGKVQKPSGKGDFLFTVIAQTCVLGGLIYSFVRYGGVDESTQYYVCLALLVAVIAGLLRPTSPEFQRPKYAKSLLTLWTVWLVVTAIQVIPMPPAITNIVASTTTQIRTEYAGEVDSWQPISLIPLMTRVAWPSYAIAFAFFLMGLSLWGSRKSKTVLLSVLGLCGGGLACWGLVQRIKRSDQLLPGIEAPENALPFATFIYKNAGASVLIATLGAAVGLTLVMLRPALRQAAKDRNRARRESQRREKGEQVASPAGGYSAQGYWTDPNVIAGLLLIGVLIIGIAASLSRGGWVGAGLALVVWAYFLRGYVRVKTMSILTVLVLIIGGGATYFVGLKETIASRAEKMSIDTLSENDRFAHWADSYETIFQYPIVGSGLGTYGYAQLPNQDADTPRWFHHAHNQILEWAVECGLFGVAILIAAILITFGLLRSLYNDRTKGSTPLIWFSVASIAGIGLIIQTVFDFVILTPSVMWIHALILGVATSAVADRSRSVGTSSQKRSGAIKTVDDTVSQWTVLSNRLARPFVWSIVAAAMLLVGQGWLQAQIIDESLLRLTRVPTRVITPTMDQVDQARERLTVMAEDHPYNGKLWQRLAKWDFAKYRLELIELAERNDETLAWNDTEPQAMFRVFHALPKESREITRSMWVQEDSQKEAIDATKQHFTRSLISNPLVPQVHLQLALIAPLTGDDFEGPASRSRQLSSSNGDLQFSNGMLAMQVGDFETMADQWRRGLRFKPENLPYVLRLASTVMKPEEIAKKILVDLRSSTWVSLVRRTLVDESMEPYRSAFIEGAKKALATDESISEGRRYFLLGEMYEAEGSTKQSVENFAMAVTKDGANADYRYRHAVALLRAGNFEEALVKASLGRALEVQSQRWKRLIAQIHRQRAEAAKKEN